MVRSTPPLRMNKVRSLQALTMLETMTAREVAFALGIKETTFSYHLRKWRVLDVIRKVGYGVWEVDQARKHLVIKPNKRVVKAPKQLRKSTPCRSPLRGGVVSKKFVVVSNGKRVLQDSIATHGCMFVVCLPSLARWSKYGRREYLSSRNIIFTIIPQGERLSVLGWKVWLTKKSLVFYAPVGLRWYASTAHEGFGECFFEFLRVLKKLEVLLGVSLVHGTRYKVKTTREHHALIGNAFADQVNRSGEKFYVRDSKGLWALVDASVTKVAELETVRAGRDIRDANERVQDLFNETKETGFSPKQTLQMIHGLAENAVAFGVHMKTHVSVMKEIRDLIHGFQEKK